MKIGVRSLATTVGSRASRFRGYSPSDATYTPISGVTIKGDNVRILDCVFDRNLQAPLHVDGVTGFYVEDCRFIDDKRHITRPQARNGSIHQFIGSGPWIEDSSEGIVRGCELTELTRGFLLAGDVQNVEIHANHFEKNFNVLVDVRCTGGRISIANNTADYNEEGLLNLEDGNPASPVYWVNNVSMHGGWPGHTTYGGQSPGFAQLNRYGGGESPIGFIGPHFFYHNTVSISESVTELYGSNNVWQSAGRKFKPDTQLAPASYFQNNIMQGFKDTDSQPGNYSVIYAAGVNAEAGEHAAKGVKFDGNQWWVLNGSATENAFNFNGGPGQQNFTDTQADLLSTWGVNWEINGHFGDPVLSTAGTAATTHAVPTIPGITDNSFLGTTSVAGASHRLTLAKYGSFDGVNDHVDITGLTSEPASPYTISIWFRLDDTGPNQTLLGRYLKGLMVLGGRPIWYRDGSHFYYVTPTSIDAEQWYHLVYVVNGLTVSGDQAYLNGATSGSSSHGAGPAITGQWMVGWPNANTVHGDVADVRIYDKALNQSEVDYLYSHGKTGNAPGQSNLLLHYDFSNGHGTTVDDRSGNNQNGTTDMTSESQFWVPAP